MEDSGRQQKDYKTEYVYRNSLRVERQGRHPEAPRFHERREGYPCNVSPGRSLRRLNYAAVRDDAGCLDGRKSVAKGVRDTIPP